MWNLLFIMWLPSKVLVLWTAKYDDEKWALKFLLETHFLSLNQRHSYSLLRDNLVFIFRVLKPGHPGNPGGNLGHDKHSQIPSQPRRWRLRDQVCGRASGPQTSETGEEDWSDRLLWVQQVTNSYSSIHYTQGVLEVSYAVRSKLPNGFSLLLILLDHPWYVPLCTVLFSDMYCIADPPGEPQVSGDMDGLVREGDLVNVTCISLGGNTEVY